MPKVNKTPKPGRMFDGLSKPPVGAPARQPRHIEGSLISQLVKLEVGEFVAQARESAGNLTVADFAALATLDRNKLRSAVNASLVRAKTVSGFSYTVDVSSMLTARDDLYHVAIIRRVT